MIWALFVISLGFNFYQKHSHNEWKKLTTAQLNTSAGLLQQAAADNLKIANLLKKYNDLANLSKQFAFAFISAKVRKG
jgi:hypothetical protein